MKRTTYTIVELEELGTPEAFEKALRYIHEQTGIPMEDKDQLMIESDEYSLTYYSSGSPARK